MLPCLPSCAPTLQAEEAASFRGLREARAELEAKQQDLDKNPRALHTNGDFKLVSCILQPVLKPSAFWQAGQWVGAGSAAVAAGPPDYRPGHVTISPTPPSDLQRA